MDPQLYTHNKLFMYRVAGTHSFNMFLDGLSQGEIQKEITNCLKKCVSKMLDQIYETLLILPKLQCPHSLCFNSNIYLLNANKMLISKYLVLTSR